MKSGVLLILRLGKGLANQKRKRVIDVKVCG